MADFMPAYGRTMKNEGGYSDDPDDRGGETYRGIARKFHPDWLGWARVDKYKAAEYFPRVLDADHALKGWVQDFYRERFWQKTGCHLVDNQALAEFMFDFAVHSGTKTPVLHVQRALNALNRNETLWKDVEVDGVMGPQTAEALKMYPHWETPVPLFKVLRGLRTAYYVAVVERREQNEKFLRGWLNRLRG
jgi:lysozyme family protein